MRWSSERRLVVTGADGQIGWELQRTLAPLGRVYALRRADVDLTDEARLRHLIRETRPAAIVNAAAYTAVDRAESEPDLAFAVNARAPEVLAEEAARLGVPLVHYSTDYVFDGTKGAPYVETDPVAPLGVYGETKLAGERLITAVGGTHLVFRTSWVYGVRGHNFLRTMLRLSRERDELRVVADQRGSPTPARLVAEVTAQVLGGLVRAAPLTVANAPVGVHHLTTRGDTTWFEFARAILALDPRGSEQRAVRVLPVSTAEFPTPARRPAFSVLDTSGTELAFGLSLPHWHDQLELVAADLVG
ncbi:MAG TPA: dTDP-4-dehydrorhamnose reductase [Gemmatimonadales bacterium]